MLPKYDVLTSQQVDSVHSLSLRILEEIGIEFSYAPALKALQAHGQQAEGHRVFFKRAFIEDMIKGAPSNFTLHARNPERNLICGGEEIILVPGYGAPFIHEADGSRRKSTMEDYKH